MAENNSEKNISLCFTGKDYTPLSDAKIDICSEVDENTRTVIVKFKTEILLKYLNSISVEELMINHSNKKVKKK